MKIKRLVVASVLSIGISFTGVSAEKPVIDVSSVAEAIKMSQELQRQEDILTHQMARLERNFDLLIQQLGEDPNDWNACFKEQCR